VNRAQQPKPFCSKIASHTREKLPAQMPQQQQQHPSTQLEPYLRAFAPLPSLR
jgi:hypothetical protein